MNEIYKMMRSQFPTAICLVLMLISADSSAHGGGLDSYGCHNDKAKGNYHCHQGKYAGREFSSKQAMIQQIELDKLDAFETRLREAKNLYGNELISEAEYEKKRADVLEDIVALSAPMEDRLKLLKRLNERDLILDDEYQRVREAILEGL